ncbi:MAG: hypothetical protein WCP22_10510 [Chlamydiota bacterium]
MLPSNVKARGSYKKGKMLFLGPGTGLGGSLVLNRALEPTDVVIGGGNVIRLKKSPPGCRSGDNADAFIGGFRLLDGWDSKRIAARKKDQFNRAKKGVFVIL